MPKCPKWDLTLAQDVAADSQGPVCKAPLEAARPAGSDVSPAEQTAWSHVRCFFCQRQEPCEMGAISLMRKNGRFFEVACARTGLGWPCKNRRLSFNWGY